MPRFKPIHKGLKMLPVDLDQQISPGTFEHALCYLVDHELDLSAFEARYRNDACGASAFAPAVLLKIVLLAYSRGLRSSRRIEAACRESVLFMAVSGDAQPHFTTIAAFISEMGDLAAKLFAQVLTICDRQGLIGREMFAIDGVKLPANASKAKSGTRADFERQARKMEAAAKAMLDGHRQADAAPADRSEAEREARALSRLQREAAQLRAWLVDNPEDRKGARGGIRKSNRTDNDSAKMATSKGVIQGYTGVATVDERAQIIVDAQAHGTGSEQELLAPVIDAILPYRGPTTIITADAGYHSKANLKALAEQGVEAYLPDAGYRKRDERYKDQDRHKAKGNPLHDKSPKKDNPKLFGPQDFAYDPNTQTCRCPAGKSLYRSGADMIRDGYESSRFKGTVRDCGPCPLRAQCLRKPEKTRVRQVAFFHRKAPASESPSDRMRARIESPEGRRMITRRFATVEPVFGNIRGNKRLDRFTLRGQTKVDGQWKLYCLMHNIEKLAHHGVAA
ncbi:IS1182 family transposase [Alkalilimnicola sp. S0819]|uniref:IS1182 family transposase n=1 Tax=Alkalilimnicola sp. S0819 TaxID=2613922 RepID=UPI001261B704|nr:IS1182 family transposase [Alkalilimnicola sp. S0819]KAB7619449.1 IS1182 family transposase [Alkalilimnicola sp. S0819]MPQ17705.1 IS1182 family transposase [Alkalilimnicola sp. S0819]